MLLRLLLVLVTVLGISAFGTRAAELGLSETDAELLNELDQLGIFAEDEIESLRRDLTAEQGSEPTRGRVEAEAGASADPRDDVVVDDLLAELEQAATAALPPGARASGDPEPVTPAAEHVDGAGGAESDAVVAGGAEPRVDPDHDDGSFSRLEVGDGHIMAEAPGPLASDLAHIINTLRTQIGDAQRVLQIGEGQDDGLVASDLEVELKLVLEADAYGEITGMRVLREGEAIGQRNDVHTLRMRLSEPAPTLLRSLQDRFFTDSDRARRSLSVGFDRPTLSVDGYDERDSYPIMPPLPLLNLPVN